MLRLTFSARRPLPLTTAPLSRRPMQGPASDEVHVHVEDGLASARADVEYCPIDVLNRALARNLGCGQMTTAHQFGVFGFGFPQSSDVFFGDDEDVSGSLGVDILEGKGVLILIDFPGRHLAANDPAKEAIGHC